MTIWIDGVEKRIGLAMSGGGFRAAAYHLGVMRELDRRRILDKLDLITCVSGGSIAGATVSLHWQNPNKLDVLEHYLRTRSLTMSTVLAGGLDLFESRTDKLADLYDEHLFKGATLHSLSDGPRIYLNATNLATGKMFFFVAGGGKPCEMGDYIIGVVDKPAFPLCRAVAASSAFPPLFAPMRLDAVDYMPSEKVDYVTLTDGGVYDNLGVNPLLRERNDLDYVIVSDGGKPFAIDTRPTESGVVALKAGIDIMMEQVRALQFKRLQHRHEAGKGPRPLWLSIDSEYGQARDGDAAFASSVGTNLNKLSDEEMEILCRHGAALVAHRLATYAPEI
ncbi:MAG: patatin-like phospholipase family protein [Pseudomonadota bacterium]